MIIVSGIRMLPDVTVPSNVSTYIIYPDSWRPLYLPRTGRHRQRGNRYRRSFKGTPIEALNLELSGKMAAHARRMVLQMYGDGKEYRKKLNLRRGKGR